MKKSVHGSKLLLVGLLLAGATVSCQKESIPAPVISELSGEFQLPARIGAGQFITVSYTLPTPAPTNVSKSAYFWTLPSAVPKGGDSETPIVDGVAKANFTVTQTPGEHTIEFTAQHTPADGSPVQIKKKSQKVTIVACDIAFSFWGDLKEEVSRTMTGGLKEDGADLVSEMERGLGGVDKNSIAQRRYFFSENKLSKVTETETVVSPSAELMRSFLMMAASLGTPTEFYTIDPSGAQTKRTMDEFMVNGDANGAPDQAKITSFGQEIGAKKINPVAVFTNGNNKVTLRLKETATPGTWAYTLEYVKK